jgi:rhodanese-related sulfurtransferase
MNDITVEELKKRKDAGEELHLIDVREPYENAEFNVGGKLIPLGSMMDHMHQLLELKDEEVILYCRSGARSGAAKQALVQMGFTNVRNLLGGVLDWQAKFK